MTDRELIELAARAEDRQIAWDARGAYTIVGGITGGDIWNPLTSGADAFRLAVKLGIFTRKDFVALLARLMDSGMAHDAAARLAVCQIAAKIAGMAAAEIGREMV